MKIVLAFDSFKGSLDAVDACALSAARLRSLFDDIEVLERPMADGGEGSLLLIERVRDVQRVNVQTVDAIGRPTTATYLLGADGTAFVEVAQGAGLPEVSDATLQPLDASSAGVGAVLTDALERGASAITLFLGGSATTDGGSGVLVALGARLLDEHGAEVPPGGAGLATLASIDVSGFDPRAESAAWTFVTDVDAPLTGPSGAAAVFGPQKGASADDVSTLDDALGRFAAVASAALGISAHDIDSRPGAGAAGGMAAVLAPLTGGSIVAGSRFFAELAGLDAALEAATLVITGEGRFDAQSLGGKVYSEVARSAAHAGVPVAVVAGGVDLGDDAPVAAFSIATGPAELTTLQQNAAALLPRAVCSVVRLVATPTFRIQAVGE